jgi:hypothetical protein
MGFPVRGVIAAAEVIEHGVAARELNDVENILHRHITPN